MNEKQLIMEMYVFSQLSQDMLTEMRNMPVFKERFRYETFQVAERLSRLRKRLRRNLPKEVLEDFDNTICGIVDDSEQYVNNVRVALRNEMLQKISYDMIEPAIMVGMIGGTIDVMQQIHKHITGRDNDDFQDCYRYLSYIDKHIGFRKLNDGVEPDFEKCKQAMLDMYNKIGQEVAKEIA